MADCQRIANGPVLLALTQAGMPGTSTGQHPQAQQLADVVPMMSERDRMAQLMAVLDRVKLYAGWATVHLLSHVELLGSLDVA